MQLFDKICTTLATKTAEYNIRKMERKAKKDEDYILNEYNEIVKLNPFYQIEKTLSECKNKVVTLVRQDVLELQIYVWFSIYNEIIVLALMMALAACLNIFIPAVVILTSFLLSRLIFKGEHLNSLNKCTVFTIVYLVGSSYLASLIIPLYISLLLKILLYAIIGIGLELLSLTKRQDYITKYIERKEVLLHGSRETFYNQRQQWKVCRQRFYLEESRNK